MAGTPPAAPSDGECAPAKLNLFLHVVARRADGRHDLRSLVAFAEFGDRLTLAPARRISLDRSGPFADALPARARDDLAVRAATRFARALGRAPDFAIALEKNIPVAAGLGGGSADAAAVLRLICRAWGLDVGDPGVGRLAARLGADVPVCLRGAPAWVGGVGESVTPTRCPRLHLLLVNPNVPLATADVFAALSAQDIGTDTPDPDPAPDPADVRTPDALVAWLGRQRNDLAAPARRLCPEISEVLSALSGREACRLARMSGSGPTCFGIFPDRDSCARAGAAIAAAHAGWWVRATRLRAAPRNANGPAR